MEGHRGKWEDGDGEGLVMGRGGRQIPTARSTIQMTCNCDKRYDEVIRN